MNIQNIVTTNNERNFYSIDPRLNVVDLQWKETSPDQLMDYKLKCVFENPRGAILNVSWDYLSQAYIKWITQSR